MLVWLKNARVYLSNLLKDPLHVQTLVLWVAALVTGLVSVEYATLFRMGERMFDSAYRFDSRLTFLITPVCLLLSWLVVRFFAPEAGGSGIPQVIVANDLSYTTHKSTVDRLLSLRTAVVKVVSSLFANLGGAAVGREGPTLQISACIFHFAGNRLRKYFPKLDTNTWIIAGSAAGLASAFNTPLGGIVYALEEMGSVHFAKVKTSLFTAVIIAGLVAQWLIGPYLYFGYPRIAPITFRFVPYAILIGIVCGSLGSAFGWLLFRLVKFRLDIIKLKWQLTATLVCALIVSALIYFNADASGAGIDSISALLFDSKPSSISLIIIRVVSMLFSYLAGGAGGVFAPSLSVGGFIGSYINGLFDGGYPNLMVLMGMIAFLTGVTRTPFTAFILVLEMTDRHSAVFPMMVCALVSNGFAGLVRKEGFYELMKPILAKSSSS